MPQVLEWVQCYLNKNHPKAFFSKQFCPKLLQASTYVRELCMITAVVKKWRQFLLGHSFVILTDHRSLKELMAQIIQTPEQQKYLTRLMGYDFTIQYRSGRSNVVADVLSRTFEPHKGMVFTLSMPHFTFLAKLKGELADNQEFITLWRDLQEHPANHSDFTYNDGLIL